MHALVIIFADEECFNNAGMTRERMSETVTDVVFETQYFDDRVKTIILPMEDENFVDDLAKRLGMV